MVINANNVVLDCLGRTINYSSTTYGAGITAQFRDNVTIQGCTVKQTNTAITADAAVKFVFTSNSKVLQNTLLSDSTNLYLQSSNGNLIDGNTISGTRKGIDLGGSNNVVINNDITSSTNEGIGVAGGGSTNNLIQNNVVRSVSLQAIKLSTAHGNRVNANTIYNNFSNDGVGISSGNDNNITNNILMGGGISLNGALRNRITGNIMNTRRGLDISGSNNNVFINNFANTTGSSIIIFNSQNNVFTDTTVETYVLTNNNAVSLSSSHNNTFVNLSAMSNRTTALSMDNSDNNTVLNGSLITKTETSGLGFRLSNANGNTISGVSTNRSYLLYSANNVISDNSFRSPQTESLVISGSTTTNNRIERNNMKGAWMVILLQDGVGNGNIITDNTIELANPHAFGQGIVVSSSNNIIDRNIITTDNGNAISLTAFYSNNNSLTGNVFIKAGANFGGHIIALGGSDNVFRDTRMQLVTTLESWLYEGSPERVLSNNQFINTSFESAHGSIIFPGTIDLPTLNPGQYVFLGLNELNISEGTATVRSSVVPFLNASARVTLNGVTNSAVEVDFEDDGTYQPCTAPQCTAVSYTGNTKVFDVASFTTYRLPLAGAGDTTPPVITSATITPGIVGGSAQITITKTVTDDTAVASVSAAVKNSTGALVATVPLSLSSGTAQSGTWTGTFTFTTQPDGTYTVTDTATDTSANFVTQVDGSVLLDRTAPITSIVSILPGAAKLTDTVTVTAATQDMTSGISGMTARDSTVGESPVAMTFLSGSTAAGASSTWQRTLSAQLPEGNHSIVVTSTDNAANTNSQTGIFNLDATAPDAPVTVEPLTATETNNPQLTFNWQPVGDTSGVSYTLQIAADAGFTNVLISEILLTEFFSPAAPLADGLYYWRVRAVDGVGNEGLYSAPESFLIDTAIPAAPTLVSPLESFTTNNAPVTFDWDDAIDPAPSSGVLYDLVVDNDQSFISPELEIGSLNVSQYTTPTFLPDGTYNWKVKSNDEAGNDPPSAPRTFTFDRNPSLIGQANLSALLLGGPSAQLTLNVSVSDSIGVNSVSLAVKGPTPATTTIGTATLTLISGTTQDGIWSGTFNFPSVPDGQYRVEVVATDQATNQVIKDVGAVTVDLTAPTFFVTSITPGFKGAGSTVTVQVSALDTLSGFANQNDVTTVDITSGLPATRTTFTGSLAANQVGTWTFSQPTAAPDGTHTERVSARDAANNTATNTGSFTVDANAPTIAVTHSPTTSITGPVTINASASDSNGIGQIKIYVDGVLKNTCTVSPCTFDSTYLLGLHTYYATATDVSGNEGRNPISGTKTFTVSNSLAWIRQYSLSTTSNLYTYANGVATDLLGNAYVAGYMQYSTTTAYIADGYVRKYDPNGVQLAQSTFTSTSPSGYPNSDRVFDVDTDGTSVYVVGITDGAFTGVTFSGLTNGFIRKYTNTLTTAPWTRQLVGSTLTGAVMGNVNRVDGVVIDTNGDVFVVGTSTTTTIPTKQIFMRKYDTNGVLQCQARLASGATTDLGVDIALDTTGVYVLGQTTGAFVGNTNAGLTDTVLIKFTKACGSGFVKQFGTTAADIAGGITAGPSGVYVTGSTDGALAGPSAGYTDVYVRKFDSNGNIIWTKQFGASYVDKAADIDLDAAGVTVVGSIGFGALPNQISAGSQDIFARKYDFNGNEVWTKQIGSTTTDTASGVADGSVYITGTTMGSMPGQTKLSTSKSEAFLVKIAEAVPDTTAPAAPVLLSPLTNDVTNDVTPTLDWTDVTDPSGVVYSLQVATDLAFSNIVVITTDIGTSTFTPTLVPGTYYWRVRAADGSGNVGLFSTPFTFTVDVPDTTPPVIVSATATPVIDGANVQLAISKTVSDDVAVASVTAAIKGPAPSTTTVGTVLLTRTSGTAKLGTWIGTFTFPSQALAPDGLYSVSDTATDTSSNSVTVADGQAPLDRTPPILSVVTLSPTIVKTGASVLVKAAVTDTASSVSTVSAQDITAGALPVTLTFLSGSKSAGQVANFQGTIISAAPDGNHNVRVNVTDVALNVGSTTISPGFFVDNTAPAAPTLLSLANTAITQDNTPTLDWSDVSDVSGVRYDLQVSTDNTFATSTLSLQDLTNSVQTVSLNDGIYYWRVRAKDSLGNIGPYSSAFSFTIDLSAPPAPQLLSPAGNLLTNDNTPTLDWTDVTDISGVTYTLQVSTNEEFTSLAVNQPGLAVSTVTPVLPDGVYYWRVTAVDGLGNIGTPSLSRKITIDTTSPSASTLVTPVSAQLLSTSEVHFDWSDAVDPAPSSEVLYDLRVDNNANMLSPEVSVLDLVVSGHTTTLADGTYYWQVQSKDKATNGPISSAVGTFTVDTTAPVIQSAAATPSLNLGQAQVTIQKTVTDATGVANVVARVRGPLPSTNVVATVPLSLLSGTAQNGNWQATATIAAPMDGTYSVEDTATDTLGNIVAKTDATLQLDLTPPTLIVVSIEPQLVNTGQNVLVTAAASDSVSGISGVTAQDITTGAPTITLMFVSGSTAAGQTATFQGTIVSASPEGGHDVQVTATDNMANPNTVVSTPGFTVDTTGPATVTLLLPTNNAKTNDNTLTFDWTDSEPGTTYRIQISRGAGFQPTEIEIDQSGISTSTLTLVNPFSDGAYFWRIQAIDGTGNAGSFSDASTLLTDTVQPGAPVLVSPASGSATNNTRPTFDWNDAPDAATSSGVLYDFIIDNNADFSSPEISATSLATSEFTPTTDLVEGKFYWQVKSKDEAGNDPPNSDEGTSDYTPPSGATSMENEFGEGDSLEIHTIATDELSGVDEVVVFIEELTTGTIVATFPMTQDTLTSPTWSADYDLTSLPDGNYLVDVRAKDGAGNGGLVGLKVISLDTSGPQINTIEPPSIVLEGEATTLHINTADPKGTKTVVVTDIDTGKESIATVVSDGPANGETNWQAVLQIDGPPGTHTITVTAIDALGNPATISFTIEVKSSTITSCPFYIQLPGAYVIIPGVLDQDSAGPCIDVVDNTGAVSIAGTPGSEIHVNNPTGSAIDGGTGNELELDNIISVNLIIPLNGALIKSRGTVQITNSNISGESTGAILDLIDADVVVSNSQITQSGSGAAAATTGSTGSITGSSIAAVGVAIAAVTSVFQITDTTIESDTGTFVEGQDSDITFTDVSWGNNAGQITLQGTITSDSTGTTKTIGQTEFFVDDEKIGVNFVAPNVDTFDVSGAVAILFGQGTKTNAAVDTDGDGTADAPCENSPTGPGTPGCSVDQVGADAVLTEASPFVVQPRQEIKLTLCGDGTFEGFTEQCDDGNTDSEDGCASACDEVESGYLCTTSGQACEPVCGDGLVKGAEACDDNNEASSDGCSASCGEIESGYTCPPLGGPCEPTCGDTIVISPETCDDGNENNDDGCSVSCQVEVLECGNGIRIGTEQCDDGNPNSNDGCSNTCQIEQGIPMTFLPGSSVTEDRGDMHIGATVDIINSGDVTASLTWLGDTAFGSAYPYTLVVPEGGEVTLQVSYSANDTFKVDPITGYTYTFGPGSYRLGYTAWPSCYGCVPGVIKMFTFQKIPGTPTATVEKTTHYVTGSDVTSVYTLYGSAVITMSKPGNDGDIVCTIEGEVELNSHNGILLTSRVVDTDVTPTQIMPVTPSYYEVLSASGEVLASGGTTNATGALDTGAAFFLDNNGRGAKNNCVLTMNPNSQPAKVRVTINGVNITKQYVPGQRLTFTLNKRSNKYFPANEKTLFGSELTIFEPAEIPMESFIEVPVAYYTDDHYWDVATSFTPPEGCTVQTSTQSTTVDQSTGAAIFPMQCGGSNSITGLAVSENANDRAKTVHNARDCTKPGCPPQRVESNIPVKKSNDGKSKGRITGEVVSTEPVGLLDWLIDWWNDE
ncbi:DUF4215 domain-containing protein [Candidatus Woesearchaeota archaeon]|nr:DUF4215 domain-containing protein [Candidatus Woesearchaeota archaeon]